MAMKKAWIYDSVPLPEEELDHGSISKSSRGNWMRSMSKGGEEMLFTISAYGELTSDEMDILHTSAAAHTNSIKKKRKKARHNRRTVSRASNPMEEKVQKEVEAPVTPEKTLVKPYVPYVPTSPTSPIIINTVDDLLRILAERGLGSVPPSPAPSALSDTDSCHSGESTAVNTPVDIDFANLVDCDSEVKLSPELESPEVLRKKLNLPADEKTIRNLQSLISYLSLPRQKVCAATTACRINRGTSAVDRARHASLKRFLAYHEVREKERSGESDEDNKMDSGAAQWAAYRSTVGPIFDGKPTSASAILKESIKLNRPPARVRKPIPTWF